MQELKSARRVHVEKALHRLREYNHNNEQIFNLFGLDIREYGDWLVDSIIQLIAFIYSDGTPECLDAIFEKVLLDLKEDIDRKKEGVRSLSVEAFVESLELLYKN